MAETQRGERDTVKETQDAFQEYAASVGHIALAWNNLHQDLGKMFVNLVSGRR